MDRALIIYWYNVLAERVFRNQQQFGENWVFSPFGIHEFLALILQDPGCRQTRAFVRNLLPGCAEIEEAPEYYRNILTHLSSLGTETLFFANSAHLKETYQLQETFKFLLLQNPLCNVESVDFSQPNGSATTINTWVEHNSKKIITKLVEFEALKNGTHLALLNVTRFGTKWEHQFNIENTTSGTFYLNNDETLEVPMMKMRKEVYYHYDEYYDCQMLELPLTSGNSSLFIILPSKNSRIKDLKNVGHNLLHYELHEAEELDISIPRFKITSGNSKDVLLQNEGDCEFEANFFRIIDSEEWLKVSKIQQTGVINVDETGLEAASGTIFTFVPSDADDKEYPPKDGLVIYQMDVKSNISNRFAKNLVISKVRNTNKSAKEATFTMVLPETAFITEFVMEIDGKVYKSEIKEKEEAQTIYDTAVRCGKSAGIVQAGTRDSNEFNVSVNLEPESVAIFSLTYEEMLQRVHDQYELVLNIRPGQIVENLNLEVSINESRPLKFVKTPALRSGNELSKNEDYLKPTADVKINSNCGFVKFSPNAKQQKRMAGYMGTNIADGFSGQFVVQYDVERDPHGGEILLQDGYFVHFFAPNDLDPLPKHVVFILDTSTSMSGRKIDQLKDAMFSILKEIRTNDLISIIEFNSDVIIWDINSEKSIILESKDDLDQTLNKLNTLALPLSTRVNADTVQKAKNVVTKISATGWTFMIGGLKTGLHIIKLEQEQHTKREEKYQPIAVFLTDGEPNIGMSSTDEITRTITEENFRNNRVPIFSLSFGSGADKAFLRHLSSKNLGFSRHIYEASDASLQLQAFYKEISSPLLTDIKFKYASDVKEVTKSHFPIYFKGSEIVVSGKYTDESLPVYVDCCGRKGSLILKSIIERPVSSLERLWAYLMVKQLLDDQKSVENCTELLKRATELALKYSFVTEVTSFVVVKPDQSDEIQSDQIKVDNEEEQDLPEEASRKELGVFDFSTVGGRMLSWKFP